MPMDICNELVLLCQLGADSTQSGLILTIFDVKYLRQVRRKKRDFSIAWIQALILLLENQIFYAPSLTFPKSILNLKKASWAD